MYKLYILSCFLLIIVNQVFSQETATPVAKKSNRIILHYKDTTGIFTQLARTLIDRGHDIEYKDREFGVLRTKPSTIPGGYAFDDLMEVKTVFRDNTITFSSVIYRKTSTQEWRFELYFPKKRKDKDVIDLTWDELMTIAGLLKPDSISYSTVTVLTPIQIKWGKDQK